MSQTIFHPSRSSRAFWGTCGVLVVLVLTGLFAAHHMESAGHWVTGMTNRVVWGMPHVFAVFLIVTASGALNVASIASVFGRSDYKSLSRLSGLLAAALLIGGLSVLVLDLGRPDRLIVAMTHYNFRSIFAWNIFLYTGFLGIVVVYLWMMFEPRMNRFVTRVGTLAFAWRIILTTGTGSIFGFLVARETFSSALLAPMFIAMSLSFGTAVTLLLGALVFHLKGENLPAELTGKLARLLGYFVLSVSLFVAVSHLTHLYSAGHQDIERFLLIDGRPYSLLFWIGQVLLGTLVPAVLLLSDRFKRAVSVPLGALLVVIGGLAQLYVLIIGGQAYPMSIVSGFSESSTFFDGVIAMYRPSLPEWGLGVGGMALAALIFLVGTRVLPFLPVPTPDQPRA
ncbi:MAG: NrfD/PsrC family molybdoenzyme membrane anchor subunit [Arenicellales bacterium]